MSYHMYIHQQPYTGAAIQMLQQGNAIVSRASMGNRGKEQSLPHVSSLCHRDSQHIPSAGLSAVLQIYA